MREATEPLRTSEDSSIAALQPIDHATNRIEPLAHSQTVPLSERRGPNGVGRWRWVSLWRTRMPRRRGGRCDEPELSHPRVVLGCRVRSGSSGKPNDVILDALHSIARLSCLMVLVSPG